MDFENFNNLASGIQSLMVAVAVLIGGGWALYQFVSMKTLAKARADLEKVKRELHERGVIEVTLNPTFLPAPDPQVIGFIHLVIELKNVGTGTEVIRWDETTFRLAKLDYDENRGASVQEKTVGKFLRVGIIPTYSTIAPKQTLHHSAVVAVQEPGVFLIDAQIIGSPKEVATAKLAGEAIDLESDFFSWGTTTYISIKGSE